MPREPATAKVRGPYAKSARIKAEVIAKATEAFAERGYTGTSMREIALAVGMTQQGLSHHFASKEALLEAVLKHRDEASLQHYGTLQLGAVETLRAVALDVVERSGLIQLTTMLAAEAITPSHPAHEFFKEHFAAARGVFTRLITRGQADGEIRDDIPADQLATLVVAVFEGLQVQWLIGPDVDIVGSVETALKVLAPPSKRRR